MRANANTDGATARDTARLAVVVGALGVVFGDIGTSPIYTVQTVFSPSDPHPVAVSTDSVFGIISLIFWSVMIIVTLTYVTLVMRADNDGEGGIMALITLIRRRRVGGRRAAAVLAALGIFGASLFFGDSMITPAISVLSAVEGLKVVQPSLEYLIVPITAVIIIVLFAFQRVGTGAVGRLFGPVMIAWFLAIGACGIWGIVGHPEILKALSPVYALDFLVGQFSIAFFALAAVVLAVTGAEALYADMGHFGRRAITRGWLILVFPACILSYLGQGALILDDPVNNISSPFFLLVPEWGRLPMVLLATAATVIASQAVITGAYSVASQAAQLGYLPRLRIVHTSESAIGQIYVPWINWVLMISVLTLVFTFQTSAALAFAFGMAVTGTITITTLLFFFVVRERGAPLWLVILGAGGILLVDLLFLGANLTKLVHGAWLPLAIGLTAFTVMTTWQRGRGIVTRQREREEGSLRAFVDELHELEPPLLRVPGTAVFLNRGKETAPLAMRANVEHNRVLHEHVVIVTIETQPVPRVAMADRLVIDDLGYTDDGITGVSARFGYMDSPNVPAVLRLLETAGIECPIEVDTASYFLSTIELRRGDAPTMARWRKHLFLATSGISADAAEYFGLPRNRTVIMGSHVEV
ncbi:MAG TPA: KUP/HAK/KT family potassium transporter [Pseudonocardia sp.]|uniref:potassium transporter Kup n=1 Tax=Pseudonocardia sp. TaxID=60912 RepID=UPI002CFBB9A9|nr:KUP/HAK/KT family potassium transporter [Pseudonocardia sp.]HTF47272.1 KUP/HAK/KT family potassium transporter [Pseudonocardia sp.]